MSIKFPILIAGQKGSGCNKVANLLKIKISGSIEILNSEALIRSTAARMGISFPEFYKKSKQGIINKEKAIRDTLYLKSDSDTIVEGKSAFKALDKPSYRILLKSSSEARAKRLSEIWEIPYKDALEFINRSDKERKKIVKNLFGKDWLDISLYDIAIDTTNISYKEVAETIMRYINSKKVITPTISAR